MKEEYDFENMTGHKNPYASKLKQQIAIKVETEIVEYCQNRSKECSFIRYRWIYYFSFHCKLQWN